LPSSNSKSDETISFYYTDTKSIVDKEQQEDFDANIKLTLKGNFFIFEKKTYLNLKLCILIQSHKRRKFKIS
jgi:hypothetical protein